MKDSSGTNLRLLRFQPYHSDFIVRGQTERRGAGGPVIHRIADRVFIRVIRKQLSFPRNESGRGWIPATTVSSMIWG
jgi:hypothetical protein